MAVTLHTTLGDLKLELYCEEAPKACENFLALAASGVYDNTIFHRLIPAFMIQGGDPTGSGRGGKSIFKTPNGKFSDEISDTLKHSRRGVVSMANSGPNTNGRMEDIKCIELKEIFLQPILYHLQVPAFTECLGKYTIFGHVIDGMDVLDRMEKSPTDKTDKPVEVIKLNGVTIHANPLA